MSFQRRVSELLTRRNVLITSLLLALTFCALYLLVDQTIAGAAARAAKRSESRETLIGANAARDEIIDPQSLFNKTAIETVGIKALREKQHKQVETPLFALRAQRCS